MFRVTGPSCGEFSGHRWIPRTKASDAELWCFIWSAPWINGWVNNREAGNLRRHRAYCDVIVMKPRSHRPWWMQPFPREVYEECRARSRWDVITFLALTKKSSGTIILIHKPTRAHPYLYIKCICVFRAQIVPVSFQAYKLHRALWVRCTLRWSLGGHQHVCIIYSQEDIKGTTDEKSEWLTFSTQSIFFLQTTFKF